MRIMIKVKDYGDGSDGSMSCVRIEHEPDTGLVIYFPTGEREDGTKNVEDAIYVSSMCTTIIKEDCILVEV